MTINELLNRYVDSLNAGTPIDINEILKLCPEADQQELKDLCNMAKVFKNNSPFIKSSEQKEDELFSHLERLRAQRLKHYEITEPQLDKVAEDKGIYGAGNNAGNDE